MSKKICFLILMLSAAILFFNCPSAVEEETYDIGISSLGWVIENIDTTFWSGTAPDATCFYNFSIYYTGNFSASKISYARIYILNSSSYWNIPINSTYVDSDKKIIRSPRFYYNTPGHRLPIGSLSAEIKLSNGQKASFNKIIPAPGSKIQGTYNYVFTENYSTPSSDYAPAVKRAAIGSFTRDTGSQTISVPFSINDNMAYDGWLWFYDNADNYVGISSHFIDTTTGVLNSSLFSGGVFNTNGTINTFNIANSNITFNSGYNFSNIAKFVLVLRDGKQYIIDSRYSAYDCRSISAKKTF